MASLILVQQLVVWIIDRTTCDTTLAPMVGVSTTDDGDWWLIHGAVIADPLNSYHTGQIVKLMSDERVRESTRPDVVEALDQWIYVEGLSCVTVAKRLHR